MRVTFGNMGAFVNELRANADKVWLNTVRVERVSEPCQSERITFNVGLYATAVIEDANGEGYLASCAVAADEPIDAGDVDGYTMPEEQTLDTALSELGLTKAGGRFEL